jgi:peptidoglycan-N-acetylglucosamine deacetylase
MRLIAALLATLIWSAPGWVAAREIALSFDDAPRPANALLTVEQRADRLISALRRAGVEQAVFFANSARIDQEGADRLRAYARAGHLIANHSATHRHLRAIEAEAYLEDIADADRVLRDYPNFRRWYRFPFLDEGDTPEKRDAVRAGLERMNYRQGYVTIDTYDWYIDSLAQRALRDGESVNMDALGALYVEVMLASANFYDQLAVTHLGRSPRHVMLLHENDLAALFIDDLVEALERDGWTIITAEAAYEDPIASQSPETMLLGQGRVAALAHDAGAPRAAIFGPYEEEAELDAMFAELVIR